LPVVRKKRQKPGKQRKEANLYKHTDPSGSDPDANFLGWQESPSGELFPLFNIILAEHPSYHSTVTDATLRMMGLRVPLTLSPYTKMTPSTWHNLGIELNHPKTAREAIEMAGLNFTVVKKPLKLKNDSKRDAYATVRTDTDEILGYVSRSYKPIQNVDAFMSFDAILRSMATTSSTNISCLQTVMTAAHVFG
jgi:hypothetical protein